MTGAAMGAAILYSFRRCPYAIRARLALAAAGLRPDLELREVNLRARPPELVEVSPKATVPVLVSGEQVLDESLAIMRWALERHEPHGGLLEAPAEAIEALIAENDGPFKLHLDRWKYAQRYGAEGMAERHRHRQAALDILRGWSRKLEPEGWLLGDRPCLADWALLPFVRQFQQTDPQGLEAETELQPLRTWLAAFLASRELARVLESPWGERTAWRSPRWLYHLALREEWQQACREGIYRRSTRGLSLEQVGFIHASNADQVAATFERFYADAAAVLLLTIDPLRLSRAGVEVRREPAPQSGELFPHLYGPLPLEAVVLAEPYRP
jgi:glutathione S-transferase